MKISVLGMDLAKHVFHVIGLNRANKLVLRKKLRRSQVLDYFAKLERTVVAMEACRGAHYWARAIGALGHTVKLLSPRDVKPYVQGVKNDYNDALAIAEAASRPKMRSVRVKTVEEQDTQALHRLKQGVVRQRTQLGNQLRGLLAEYGVVIGKGLAPLRRELAAIIGGEASGLSDRFRQLLKQGYERLKELDGHVNDYDRQILEYTKSDEAEQRLQTIPGFGPIVSSVYHNVVGDGQAFSRGRDVSAYVGLVPRQYSSGDKQVLLGITKCGNTYLRSLLVHGARAVVRHAPKKDDPLSRWVTQLVQKRGKNKATVALANKLARIGWAVLTTGGVYQAKHLKV